MEKQITISDDNIVNNQNITKAIVKKILTGFCTAAFIAIMLCMPILYIVLVTFAKSVW